MTPLQYHSAALRTLVLRGQHFGLEHSILGLITELGEFATNIKRHVVYGTAISPEMHANMVEELGDLLWYVPCGLRAIGLSLPDVWPTFTVSQPIRPTYLVRWLLRSVGNLNNEVLFAPESHKAAVPVSRLASCYRDICIGVLMGAAWLEVPVEQIMQQNIDKLARRYPDKFTPELAERRLDKDPA